MKNRHPLEGITVIDLSRVLAGPFCTQILGDLGAHVIKIESEQGDDTRRWKPPMFNGDSVYFLSANRNKRIATCDFNKPNDRARLIDLMKTADVCVENFKTDSLKKFGLDYESLSALNPRLVYASITGFGQTGPYAHRPGYDLLIQAMGGFMSVTGSDEDHPTKAGVAIIDIATGLYAVIGILAALRAREVTGRGEHIDLALLDTSASLLSYLAMNYLVTGQSPKPMGNAHPTIVPYQVFSTADRPLLITIGNEAQFRSLCESLQESWHEDIRFHSNEARENNRSVLVSLIETRLKTRPRSEWLEIFKNYSFPHGPLYNIEEMAHDAHVIARGIFTTLEDGLTPTIASPLRFKNAPKAPLRLALKREPIYLDKEKALNF